MVMAVAVSRCSGDERAELLGRLDQEFIYGRGRTLGLEARLPEAMGAAESLFLCAHAERKIVGGLLLRLFEWDDGSSSHRGAMIGLVWTDPAYRGQGVASRMLKAAATEARTSRCEFAVLWTAQPGFYARLGWTSADCGLLGVLDQANTAAPDVTRAAPGTCDVVTLASLAAARNGYRVVASARRFDTLLPPATERDVLVYADSYAVTGRLVDTGYVYEFGGSPTGLPQIWSALRTRHRPLYLNVRRDDAAHRILAADPAVRWETQRLAMWLPLTEEARAFPYGDWYVPFLDRI
jgi:predicted N-acetyltransferase YhbS